MLGVLQQLYTPCNTLREGARRATSTLPGMRKRAREGATAEPQEPDTSETSSGVSDSEASREPSASGSEGGEVQVDFEFHDPRESDFLGLKALLHSYLDGQDFSCSELVDAVIRQARAPQCSAACFQVL